MPFLALSFRLPLNQDAFRAFVMSSLWFERPIPVFFFMKDCLVALRLLWIVVRFGPALLQGKGMATPLALRLLFTLTFFLRSRSKTPFSDLSVALTKLGPAYVKLGQFLATRPDLVGHELALGLQTLQDRVPPFSQKEAISSIEQALGAPLDDLFSSLSPPVAAASIAQVHKATLMMEGREREVAVKILRPGIEKKFFSDLHGFARGARFLEFFFSKTRRLKPVEVVETLKRSVILEMDLRMEGAALSEMRENLGPDPAFMLPQVHWQKTAQRILTTEWICGIALSNREEIVEAGGDLPALAQALIQGFLTQVLEHGFFHADLHQGNLLYASGTLWAVDLGIVGRLSLEERRFLAEILLGFITKNYRRLSDVHFEAGYTPPHHDKDAFAQALRAIGEPIFGLSSQEISMGRLLAQLFQVTEQFDMQTQPQLLLLQKTMVMVEGVARFLDPQFNMWEASEPLLRTWMHEHLGPKGRLLHAKENALLFGQFLNKLPHLLSEVSSFSKGWKRPMRPPSQPGFSVFFWGTMGMVVALGVGWFLGRM